MRVAFTICRQKISWTLTEIEMSVDKRCKVTIYTLVQLVYQASGLGAVTA